MLSRLSLAASLALLAPAALAQPVLYVDADAGGASTGASWADAFVDLQDALAAARADASAEEIWIAEGTYTPTDDGDRGVSFELVSGVGLYGGFDGTEAVRGEADPDAHQVVLSGDIGVQAEPLDNSYAVLVASGASFHLDGVTVAGGMANEYAEPSDPAIVEGGAGLRMTSSSASLARCRFVDNAAGYGLDHRGSVVRGGAIYAHDSVLDFTDVVLTGNNVSALDQVEGGALFLSSSELTYADGDVSENVVEGIGAVGGGVVVDGASSGTFSDVSFVRNEASGFGAGGGLLCAGSCFVKESSFVQNATSPGNGGAIAVVGSTSYLAAVNLLLAGNEGTGGGAVYVEGTADIAQSVLVANGGVGYGYLTGAALYVTGEATVSSSTFSAHYAPSRPDSQPYVFEVFSGGQLAFQNVVVSEDELPLVPDGGQITVSSALIPGGFEGGTDVLDAAPLFVREPSPGPDGTWGTGDDDYGDIRLFAGSPALNAGDDALLPADVLDLDGDGDTTEPLPLDFAGEARVQGEGLDLGALEGAVPVPLGPIVFVDADAVGAGTGTTWGDAFPNLQDALALARDTSIVEEIWIAEGTYTPTDDGDRTVSFDLVSGVGLYGGFAGTETDRDEAAPAAHPVVLSGDIGVLDEREDNSYRVIRGVGLPDMTRLDGLTITAGRSNLASTRTGAGAFFADAVVHLARCSVVRNSIYIHPDSSQSAKALGAGIYASGSDLRIEHASIVSNSASSAGNGDGGGIYAVDTAVRLSSSELSRNYASGPEESYGGGLYISASSSLTAQDVLFSENVASLVESEGGALFCASAQGCRMEGATFVGNSSGQYYGYGGAISVSGDATITSSSFYANESYGGGALKVSGNADVSNSVFVGNLSRSLSQNNWNGAVLLVLGGNVAMHGISTAANATKAGFGASNEDGRIAFVSEGSFSLTNSIIREDSTALLTTTGGGTAAVQQSLVTSGYPDGTGIIDADPLFEREPSPGPDGEWGTDDDDYGDLRLRWTSPAVDAGDASLLPADVLDLDGDGDTAEPLPLDADGSPRVQGTALDLGAYESPFNVAAEDEPVLPAALALTAAPNPFATAATVTLALPESGEAHVAAYDVLGRRVAVLHDGPLAAGRHPLALGAGLAPGLYLVRAETGGRAITLRVTKSR